MSTSIVFCLLFILWLFSMDILFDRIPSCVQNGLAVEGALCMEETVGYVELSFYDPTIPEPARWEDSNLLLQFGHPTIRKVPVTWVAWRVGWKEVPIDGWAYHNALPGLGFSSLPALNPPIQLSDGSFATDIRQLEQVRTK